MSHKRSLQFKTSHHECITRVKRMEVLFGFPFFDLQNHVFIDDDLAMNIYSSHVIKSKNTESHEVKNTIKIEN